MRCCSPRLAHAVQAADQLGLDAPTAELAMQCLTNYARAQQSLAPVHLNATLNAAGQAKLGETT